jgi:hypothetical protein
MEKYSIREDRFLIKRGRQEHWKWISHRKRKWNIHTTLKPPVRSFKSFLEMMKWIRNTLPRWRIMGFKPEASLYAHLAEVYAIESEEEEKMAPHLSCEINGVQCKALCDIGAQVNVLSSKIYDKVQDHSLYLAPTSTKLIMGYGRTIRPLGIACNMNVNISGKMYTNRFLCY